MKKILAFLTFFLFLLLLWFAWNWYKETVVCCTETVVEAKYGPLYYDCNSDEPITSDVWAKKKSEILSAKAEGKKLLIVGPYFDGENKDSGLKRAKKVKALFIGSLTDDDIELSVKQFSDCEAAKKDALGKTLFKWVVRNEHVIEHHDKTFIYFKYDTDKPIDTKHVIVYLDNLAKGLQASGQTVQLTGHTDADGDDAYNMKIGMRRANRVKTYLISKGVSEDKISVDSKGKREPIDTNGTPEGKQRNRKVEIKI